MSSLEPRWIVVDDTDPAIEYVGPWFQDTGSQDTVGSFGPAYLNSLHGTNQLASLSFSFNGSQVKVFGTNNVVNRSGVLAPGWECFVDEIKTGANVSVVQPQNRWILCEQDQLVDGPHTITVNSSVSSQTFWFDQIQYVPSSSVSLDQKAIYIDNTDHTLHDAFGPGWIISGNEANMTNYTNSLFTLDLIGVSLTWYGVIRPELPTTPATGSFAIDRGKSQTFRLKGLSPGETTQYNQIFFQTPQFPQGKHTIAVTYLGDSTTTPLTLDYLIVQNGTIPSIMPSSNSITTGDPSTAVDIHTHRSVGRLVGAIVGALVVVLFISAALVFYLRRRQKKRKEGSDDNIVQPFHLPVVPTSSSPGSYFSITPFQIQEGSRAYNASSPPTTISQKKFQSGTSASSVSNTLSYVFRASLGSSKARREVQSAGATSARRTRANVYSTTSRQSSTSRVIMHEDSGVRLPLPGVNEEVIEVPPHYTPT